MSGTIDLAIPTPETSHAGLPAEWLGICRGGHNVLLEGSRAATEAALATLEPYLRRPVTWEQLRVDYELHARPAAVIVVRGAESLRADEQRRLLALLSDTAHRRQAICSTTSSLFSLVARGVFDETLYYRLNVVMLRM